MSRHTIEWIIEVGKESLIGLNNTAYSMRHPLFKGYLALEHILRYHLGFSNITEAMEQAMKGVHPDQHKQLIYQGAMEDKYIQRIQNEIVYIEGFQGRKINLYRANQIFCDLLTEVGCKEIADTYYEEIKRKDKKAL